MLSGEKLCCVERLCKVIESSKKPGIAVMACVTLKVFMALCARGVPGTRCPQRGRQYFMRWSYFASLCLYLLGAFGMSHANDRSYRYELEMSVDDQVCQRMLAVYNSNFREPWKTKDWRKQFIGTPEHPQWEINEEFGPTGIYAFPKLPGVEHDPQFTYEMRYSKLPTSPEFEVIEWCEWRFADIYAGKNRGYRPILVAEFDIDNNGSTDTVIKKFFMSHYTTFGGWYGGDGGEDSMVIYPKGEFSLALTPTADEVYHGKVGMERPRVISNRQLRPFIIKNATYLSQYEDVWPMVDGIPSPHQEYPNREYIHIIRYYGGGQDIGGGKYTELDIKPICRLRMIPIP